MIDGAWPGKLPWDDPAFSARMLVEHLSQEHDAASRRLATIDAHVAWLHDHVLHRAPSRILDLGCGPGLYTERLAALGHECTGIDFPPASIDHACAGAAASGSNCTYHRGDLRTAEYGRGYDLALFLFGELNTFPAAEAAAILQRVAAALRPRGRVILEVHTETAVREMGEAPAAWQSPASGLFSPRPHMLLSTATWLEPLAVERFWVIDTASGDVTRYVSSTRAYTSAGYRELLASAGLEWRATHDGLGARPHPGLFVIEATRAP